MKIVKYALALRNVIVHKTLLTSTVLALTCAPSLGGERQFSGLWGRSGEKWQPQSRLPDFSYAGYHRGERPLPTRSGDLSVKDFGAVGDGRSDDTEPFKKAIEAGKGKVILIPAGHYKITDVLTIGASGTCLKGAGRRKSILFIPIPLNEVKPSSSGQSLLSNPCRLADGVPTLPTVKNC